MKKLFSLASWNVEHLKDDPARLEWIDEGEFARLYEKADGYPRVGDHADQRAQDQIGLRALQHHQ